MNYEVTYHPKASNGFADENQLKEFINFIMRTDVTQRYSGPLTRRNLYFLRNKDGELEYYVNVMGLAQRRELKQFVLDAIKDIPLTRLRSDIINISPNVRKEECLEYFSVLTAETLPTLWSQAFPEKDIKDFLSGTVAFVMHVDQSFDGDVLQYHVHRLYISDDEEG